MGRPRRKQALRTAAIVPYYRVSTMDQTVSGLGLEAQRRAVVAYAGLYKLELAESVEDLAESGKSLDRPGVQRVFDMLTTGQAAGVIVAKLDRLTRSVRDLGDLIERFFGEKGGRQLVSVGEQIDTRSAGGRLVLNVLASVGQWEREAISERVKAALASKRARGERAGSLPFGFELDLTDPGRHNREDGRPQLIRPNRAEQATLKEAHRLLAKGLTGAQIAAELNRQGRPCRGRKWRQPSVWKLLFARPSHSPSGGKE